MGGYPVSSGSFAFYSVLPSFTEFLPDAIRLNRVSSW